MDLSKVLGDVYADDVSSRPTAPEWADEAHLDEAFAGWTPGPPPEAPAAEHEMAAHEPSSHHRIDDDLAAALTQALSHDTVYPEPVFADHADLEDEAEAEPVAYEPAPVAFEPEVEVPSVPVAWSRGDDDVLPSGKRHKGLFSRLSR
jgi:hypothetical protein